MSRTSAYSLVELMAAVVISSLLIISTTSMYGLYRRSIGVDLERSNNAQTARVVLDRLTRELRFTPQLVTASAQSADGSCTTSNYSIPTYDPSFPSANLPCDITFKNGDTLESSVDFDKYYRYFLQSGTLMRTTYSCVLGSDPALVNWFDTTVTGNPATCTVDSGSMVDIALNIGSLKVYQDTDTDPNPRYVTLVITAGDDPVSQVQMKTSVYMRNI
jgi:Tfp pilus assembly protein PilW